MILLHWRGTAARSRAGRLRCSPRALLSTHSILEDSSTHRISHTALAPRVWNSLTARCDPLHAADPRVLKWYACGPTVYDRAHLGHARAYVSQDILRRVLEKHCRMRICLVMGVTDVDDKILRRAREQDQSWQELARTEERAFFEDMERLHVRSPSAITRVSEHMDEIVAYIRTIERKGFAYSAPDGSGVFFDTKQLGAEYGKLDPDKSKNGSSSQEDAAEPASAFEKRDPRDFALWKTAKDETEPSWASPWGRGRPGWHIECSAMSHHVLGSQLDVHSGGIDLQFPHHNNEIAQCEAHNRTDEDEKGKSIDPWCRHFIHFGHLYIRGLKMSKSLKNFISIRDFLEHHTADQFRVFCLQYKYRARVHFSEDRIRDANVVIERIHNFLRTARAHLAVGATTKRCEASDIELLHALSASRAAFDVAVSDDFDTPTALQHVLELISQTHVYLLDERTDRPLEILRDVTTYVLDVMDTFGLQDTLDQFADLLGRRTSGPVCSNEHGQVGDKIVVRSEDVLDLLVRFRASLRTRALESPRDELHAWLLDQCDTLRDRELPRLGVLVEDSPSGQATVKILTKQEQNALHAVKQAEATAKQAAAQRQRELEAAMQVAPTELFRQSTEYAGKYAQFDVAGVPTHDAAGAPLSKSQRKKLVKKMEKHASSYAKFWQRQA